MPGISRQNLLYTLFSFRITDPDIASVDIQNSISRAVNQIPAWKIP